MALSTSPRKVVPLATGDDIRPRNSSSTPSVTNRVFYCGVVVEGSENGRRLPEGSRSFSRQPVIFQLLKSFIISIKFINLVLEPRSSAPAGFDGHICAIICYS